MAVTAASAPASGRGKAGLRVVDEYTSAPLDAEWDSDPWWVVPAALWCTTGLQPESQLWGSRPPKDDAAAPNEGGPPCDPGRARTSGPRVAACRQVHYAIRRSSSAGATGQVTPSPGSPAGVRRRRS